MKRVIFALGIVFVFACSKTEVPVTPPVVVVPEEAIKFTLTPDNTNGAFLTSNDTLSITVNVSSKLPASGLIYSIELKRLDTPLSIIKIDSSILQSSLKINLTGLYVKASYSVSVTVTSKSTSTNSSIQTLQVNKSLKSSYDMLMSSQWLMIPSGYASYSIFDYNRDGIPDVLEFQGYDISVPYSWPGPFFYKNTGTSLVADNLSINNKHIFSSKILPGDFNNDGYVDAFLLTGMDAAGCNNCGTPLIPLYMLANQGGAGFKVDSLNYVGAWYTGCSGDIDGDGDLDIITFTIDHRNGLTNRVFINNGKGNFTVKTSDIDNLPFTDISELIDMNNDGYPDLVINDNTNTPPYTKYVRIFWNDKQGNFTLANATSFVIPSNMFFNQVLAYDFDKDGYKEIILSLFHNADNGSELQVFKTKDNKTFTEVSSQFFSDNQLSTVVPLQNYLVVSDVDNNGLIDLFNIDKRKNLRWEWNGTVFIKK